MSGTDRREFCERQRELLKLEQQAEVEESKRVLQQRTDAELAARGTTLLRLEVADLEPGFGGRLHAVLRPSRTDLLPAHRLSPGDIVALRANRDDPSHLPAVIVRVRRDQLVVSLDDEEPDLPSLVRVDRMTTDVTFRRLDAALRELARDAKGERQRFLDVLFGHREPETAGGSASSGHSEIRERSWFEQSLDASQRAAVAFALDAQPVTLIHGPPGTGKTTALVELCRQAVARGERLLACAPSNIAVDNLSERLARAGLKIVRIGHPARVHDQVRDVSLAQQVADAPEQKLVREARRELDQAFRRMNKAKNRSERHAAREEVRRLRGDRRQLEKAISRGIVDGADIVLATTTSNLDAMLGEKGFERVIVDEAAQALEAACWNPLRHANRVVLAGDHRQLPPTVMSAEAAQGGLARTMLERLSELPSMADHSRMLTVQYRMHQRIMGWSSDTFYQGALSPHESVAGHLLTDLEEVATTEWTSEPLCFIDTAGCGHEETLEGNEDSKHNPGEADLVVRIVTDLLEANVPASSIAVITPYNAQVQRLRERLADEALEIGTVDGLQGREKEAVIVSLVRSNERGEVGFLAELRRLNVAVTRARRHLTIVGDSATLASDRDLCKWIDHLQAHGTYRSAFELS